jgi:hypothetical protein
MQSSIPKNTCSRIEKLVLAIFLFSAAFMITSANNAINHWPSPWNQLLLALACLSPFLLVLLINFPKWLQGEKIRLELFFVLVIYLLGILNTAFGDQFLPNLKGMGLFLLSGVSVFAAAIFILESHRAKTILFWLYTIALLVITSHSTFIILWQGTYSPLFSNNPIPESAIITLLLAGPIMLLENKQTIKWKITLLFCILYGVVTIIALQERAPILSIFIIVFLLGAVYLKRFWVYFLCLVIAIPLSLMIGYKYHKMLPEKAQHILTKITATPIYRIEMYFVAHHLIKRKPLFGVGLWTPLNNNLYNYKEKIFISPKNSKGSFLNFVQSPDFSNTSFHNMLLCMLVQMGGLFTITYLWLLYYVLSKSLKLSKGTVKTRHQFNLLAILLFGLLIQSMSVDILMYPDINFVFHSLLAVMLNINSNTKDKLNPA